MEGEGDDPRHRTCPHSQAEVARFGGDEDEAMTEQDRRGQVEPEEERDAAGHSEHIPLVPVRRIDLVRGEERELQDIEPCRRVGHGARVARGAALAMTSRILSALRNVCSGPGTAGCRVCIALHTGLSITPNSGPIAHMSGVARRLRRRLSVTRTYLQTAALVVLHFVSAGSASAQSHAGFVPPGYTSQASPAPASFSQDPTYGLELAINASLSGDRRFALQTMRELERRDPRSPRLRLVRASLEMRLDPRLALTLSEARVEALDQELEAIRGQRRLGIGLGVAAAITGAASALTMFVGLVSGFECSAVLFIPVCGTSGPDHGTMVASATLGTTALVLSAISIGTLVDAGARQGRLRRTLQVSGGASAEGWTVSASGSF